ncbi:bifunctional phosphopantothenoylcysteine decarboxylase/phosphopantothenate--cysteine ligase CoaBC [Ferrovum myxofaciens]|uniref:bifunctional phosphopantothenoylcysteine decarboxylase/phosphopantothenate--cysteine ligase CoaBC n=1 Tax=Ferrovum myxofaciens TaxID=416213 RepID=UPI00235743E8|nr:bifunctional phosphopantothenoylcysteine decarboxylase/phosphopantothenate--cysteine ligase CoaBC [Ferrovum myxofaciens]MBU6994023.1 bifunctional phosphopantothenoylcysteine decarboxylase/phosphopantothenate--cysteine ligase CoaBC [Ferrovum myxofaciens]
MADSALPFTSPHPLQRWILGVTGGVAAYKAAELTRLMVKAGLEVQVVMTESATRFVTPLTFQALSTRPVATHLWEPLREGGMDHIDLVRHADALLIAPVSANCLAHIAAGLADDLLTTLVAARTIPLFVAPAMNQAMWQNPANQRNVAQLQEDGVVFLGPARGSQACGESGLGRLLEPNEIMTHLSPHLGRYPLPCLQGKKVLLTAGPTVEAIDPVRILSNISSGKMGYALAEAALASGAEVVLVSGPTALAAPAGCRLIPVRSAAQMRDAVLSEIPHTDLFFAVAAVADYTPACPSGHKIKKSGEPLTLTLVPTSDILATVASLPNPPFCVGFAAESQNLEEYAKHKRLAKKIPLIVGNLAQRALGREDNEVILFDDHGRHPLPPASKIELARQILSHAVALMAHRGISS